MLDIYIDVLIFRERGVDTGESIASGECFDCGGYISLPHAMSVAPVGLFSARLLLGFRKIDDDLGWILEETCSFFFGHRIVDDVHVVRGGLGRPLSIGERVEKSHLGISKDGVRRRSVRRDDAGDAVDEADRGAGKQNAAELSLI